MLLAMAMYYFETREGLSVVHDEEGLDLPDLDAVEREAAIAAAEIARAALPINMATHVVVDARDGNGNLVLSATATLLIVRG